MAGTRKKSSTTKPDVQPRAAALQREEPPEESGPHYDALAALYPDGVAGPGLDAEDVEAEPSIADTELLPASSTKPGLAAQLQASLDNLQAEPVAPKSSVVSLRPVLA